MWDKYSQEEVRVYYIECKIREVEEMRHLATSARVAQTDKKGWTGFTKSLTKDVSKLRLELEDEVIEGSASSVSFKGGQGIDDFFGRLANLPKMKSKSQGESGEQPNRKTTN